MKVTAAMASVNVLTADELLKYWQQNRKLTRKTIEAFPEDKLFQFSLAGMRPFADMVWECIQMTIPTVDGVSSGKWEELKRPKPTTKGELLQIWDEQSAELDEKFSRIPPHRFSELDKAFGMWEASGVSAIQYVVDNEVHHRGQGFVYLRALGIEPPRFWERD